MVALVFVTVANSSDPGGALGSRGSRRLQGEGTWPHHVQPWEVMMAYPAARICS